MPVVIRRLRNIMNTALGFTAGNINDVFTVFQVIKKAFCISTLNSGLIFYQTVRMVILSKNK